MIALNSLIRTIRWSLCILALLSGIALPAFAEDFSVQDTSGKTHTLAYYKGRWVLVNFWATWCPPCLEEIPDLIALQDKRKDVAVIGIAMEYRNAQEVSKFVDENLMSYPIVLGDDKTMQQFGTVAILPTTYFYNPAGKLVRTQRGIVTRQTIDKVLAGKN
jgi:thiol-disulfide isomerase/thioredoxin